MTYLGTYITLTFNLKNIILINDLYVYMLTVFIIIML